MFLYFTFLFPVAVYSSHFFLLFSVVVVVVVWLVSFCVNCFLFSYWCLFSEMDTHILT